MDIYLDTLLNLPHVTVESCIRQDSEVVLKLCLLNHEASCPYCKQLTSEINQTRYILVRDLSISGQATYLKLPRRQFYCRSCQQYFTESLSFVDEGRQYTKRYEEHIYQQVQSSSIQQVSRVEDISFERIEGIFKRQYAQKKTPNGQVLNGLELMRLANAKGSETLSQSSVILKQGN